MIPMLPLCDSRAMCMPINVGGFGASPVMMPMMPMAGAPLLYPPNQFNLASMSTVTNEYDSHMYGRFRYVERDDTRYRHAPFDWYRPPKQYHHVVHEDAAVVTADGPVPIGDFYRYYIYGDDDDDDAEDSLSSFDSIDNDDDEQGSYEPRRSDYRRDSRLDQDVDNGSYRPQTRQDIYSTLNSTRRSRTGPSSGTDNQSSRNRATGTLAGDDDFNDAASVNSTYGN
jgi:hypothetical protein